MSEFSLFPLRFTQHPELQLIKQFCSSPSPVRPLREPINCNWLSRWRQCPSRGGIGRERRTTNPSFSCLLLSSHLKGCNIQHLFNKNLISTLKRKSTVFKINKATELKLICLKWSGPLSLKHLTPHLTGWTQQHYQTKYDQNRGESRWITAQTNTAFPLHCISRHSACKARRKRCRENR